MNVRIWKQEIVSVKDTLGPREIEYEYGDSKDSIIIRGHASTEGCFCS